MLPGRQDHNDIPESLEIPPRCPECGEFIRPDEVWFGESLPPLALQAARDAATGSEIFLSIGTSTLVEPAASLPFIALQSGATVVEVNPAGTPDPLCNLRFTWIIRNCSAGPPAKAAGGVVRWKRHLGYYRAVQSHPGDFL
jgi:NAD-dependent SIR2 family protein deacetylase